MDSWKLIKKDLLKKVKSIKNDNDLKEFVDLFFQGFTELEKGQDTLSLKPHLINEISYVG